MNDRGLQSKSKVTPGKAGEVPAVSGIEVKEYVIVTAESTLDLEETINQLLRTSSKPVQLLGGVATSARHLAIRYHQAILIG